jgi:hypothetical protein
VTAEERFRLGFEVTINGKDVPGADEAVR